MWKLTATWRHIGENTVRWDKTAWPDFTTFLMAMSINQDETYNDMLYIGTRVSNFEPFSDASDESIAGITTFTVPSEQVKNEIVEYYNNIVTPRYNHLVTVSIVAEQVY